MPLVLRGLILEMLLIGQGLRGGGAELSMLRLAENFRGRGYDVRVAVLKKKGELAAMLPEGRAFLIEGRDHNLAVGDKTYKAAVLAFLEDRP